MIHFNEQLIRLSNVALPSKKVTMMVQPPKARERLSKSKAAILNLGRCHKNPRHH